MPAHEGLLSSLALSLSLLVCLRLAWLLCRVIWSRRRQLFDYAFGVSSYNLLPCEYHAPVVGMVHHHEHDHHGAHEQPIAAHRLAVVTGASRGIGRAFVRALAEQGWCIACVDLDDSELDATVSQTCARLERGWRGGVWVRTKRAPVAIKVGCDVTSVRAAMDTIQAALKGAAPDVGAIRLLINTVGVCTEAPTLLMQHDAVTVERIVSANTLFALQLTRSLWPALAEGCQTIDKHGCSEGRRSGVLFVSSGAWLMPAAYATVYAASNAALGAFARGLRAESVGLSAGVDVLAVTPGATSGCGNVRWSSPSEMAWLTEPEAVARAALLLLPTATDASITPLLVDAFRLHFLAPLLPEIYLSRRLFERHAAQRRGLIGD